MKLYEDDLGLGHETGADSALFAPPSSNGIDLAQPPAGVGLGEQPPAPVADMRATPVPQSRAQRQMDARKQTFSELSPMDKFFTAAGEFGAGVLGKPSPLNAEIKARREERVLEIEESKAAIDGLKKGLELMEGLDGEARAKFAGQYGENLERLFPGTAAIFKAAADNPGLVKDFEQYKPYLEEPIQIMMVRSPREFRKWANSAEGLKTLIAAKDRFHIRVALKKAEPSLKGAHEFVPPEVLKDMGKDGRLAFSEFMKMQQYLPEKLRLSPSELEAVRADPKKFSLGANLIDPDTENEIAKSIATKRDPAAKVEWVGRPGGMKQQAAIDKDGKILRYLGEPIAAHAPAATTHVYSGSVTPAVDAKGNPIFIQPSPKADTPPRVVEGAFPPERADATRRKEKESEGQRTWKSIDRQITELESIISSTEGKFTSATGVKGMATRVGESVAGAFNPDAATPALDAKNRKELLVASLRKTMADSNMSKADKDALETAIGGIESAWGTKGSTLRGLNNLRGFARDKYVKGDAGPGGDKFVVGQVYKDAKGNQAEYLGNGKWKEK